MKNKTYKILLVDDNETTNFIHQRLIQQLGTTYVVDVAENGQEALDYLTQQGKYQDNTSNTALPDIILLDINMPIMDGWEFLDAYVKLNVFREKRVPVVILTTSPNPQDKQKANTFKEVVDFKNKPLTSNMLLELLENPYNNGNNSSS
ncbi:response regulator [Rapidithrix thailandica]|uniref:Response regulator n=1 Tax=Rapidithrix thailandica TaxID=413964 RepID=A0AAW9RXU1_9BACT